MTDSKDKLRSAESLWMEYFGDIERAYFRIKEKEELDRTEEWLSNF